MASASAIAATTRVILTASVMPIVWTRNVVAVWTVAVRAAGGTTVVHIRLGASALRPTASDSLSLALGGSIIVHAMPKPIAHTAVSTIHPAAKPQRCTTTPPART